MKHADAIAGIERRIREEHPADGDKPVPRPIVPTLLKWLVAITVPLLCACVFMQPSALMHNTVMDEPSAVSSVTLDGMHATGDGTYAVDDDAPTITIGFDEPFALSTMTMRLAPQDDAGKTTWQRIGFDAGDMLTITASTRVAGDDEYTLPRTQTLLSDNEQTETIVLRQPGEKVDSVQIRLPDAHAGDTVSLAAPLAFNDRVPEAPYLPILLLLLAIGVALLLLRPTSVLSCWAYRNHHALGRTVLAVMVASLCVLCVATTYVSERHDESTYNDTFNAIMDPNQYQHVTDAILEGHAYLDEEPPEWLADADNPYDYDYRHDTSAETGEPYLFDYAFHDGRYYSYDGILPVLLVFLPYRFATGANMGNELAMAVMGCAATCASVFLGVAVMRRHRRNASISECAIAGFAMWLCSCVPWLCFYPSVYHEVIVVGMTVAETGVGLWLVADGPLPRRKAGRAGDGESGSEPSADADAGAIERKDATGGTQSDAQGTVQPVRRVPLAIGSLLVGMTILARPTLLLCALLAFPVFGHRFLGRRGREREFFGASGSAVANTLLVIVPVLLCAAVAMWWNYARFGNPLDFGYKYNLTGFDMVHKAFSKRRCLFGLLMYLFAPLRLTHAFPFFSAQWTYGWYQFVIARVPGVIQEPYYGGVIAFFPFLLCVLASFGKKTKAHMRGRGIVPLMCVSGAVAVAIMAFDASTAITQRYLADFAWLLGIAAIAAVATCADVRDEERGHFGEALYAHAPYVMLMLCFVSFALVLVNLLATDRYSALSIWNPQVWWTCWSWFLGIY